MPITRFEDIEAWQEARTLTRMIYEVTHADRFGRDFGLTDQLRKGLRVHHGQYRGGF